MNSRQNNFAAFVAANPNPHGPAVFHTCCICRDKSPTYQGFMPRGWQADRAGNEYCKRSACRAKMPAKNAVPTAPTPVARITLAKVPASAANPTPTRRRVANG